MKQSILLFHSLQLCKKQLEISSTCTANCKIYYYLHLKIFKNKNKKVYSVIRSYNELNLIFLMTGRGMLKAHVSVVFLI